MKFVFKAAVIVTLLVAMLSPAGCTALFREDDRYIITAEAALRLLGEPDVVLVYLQRDPHVIVEGAVIIAREDIVIDDPVPGMLLPQDQFEELMGRSGISNDSLVIIYDSGDTRDAARLWWTLRVYGHTNAKVVSGGLAALVEAGAATITEAPVVTPTTYTAQPANHNLIATIDEVLSQVVRPAENVHILDNRSREEFDAGRIEGAILLPHVDNLHDDGTFKSIEWIRLMYRDKGIRENDTIILYCRTGTSSATNFLALYNAGFENLKIFDGSWLEWTAAALPVELPPVEAPPDVIPEPVPV